MISLVWLTNRTPSKLADELIFAGYRVFEALTVSEVFHLCARGTPGRDCHWSRGSQPKLDSFTEVPYHHSAASRSDGQRLDLGVVSLVLEHAAALAVKTVAGMRKLLR